MKEGAIHLKSAES